MVGNDNDNGDGSCNGNDWYWYEYQYLYRYLYQYWYRNDNSNDNGNGNGNGVGISIDIGNGNSNGNVIMGASTSSSVKEEPTTRVLSIDGGGVRALIPLVILAKLESQLQKIDGKDARIADYFDVIAGTNTGALTAAMLTTPNENNRPMFTVQEIQEFYLDNFPKIFPQGNNIFSRATKKFKWWFGREIKYNGKYVNSVIKEKLGDTKLNQTLTDIVITTDPITFSTNQVENKNVSLSDICIGSLAFPTYLPPHSFVTKDSDGNSKQFDLIGSAVDNPVNIYLYLTLFGQK
ncbi:PREDICTED: patatin-like protein 2 [Erythranthe guttata]|uniref:patatin-like protein 2 n=1 Tax=Erythranthe guttata TaxID=4155 RepID=UPI00064DFD52|nr:PREDICTED: patatin-like protein 2 [Erythranthe guttata]|eukprot:XP_012844825.1 PREDICTED: patatin-like protein 2 [Erythranthe guttata]